MIIADAGPLVAYLDRSDHHHEWAKMQMSGFTAPLFTCEAVLAEASFLLRRGRINPSFLLQLLERGVLKLPMDLAAEASVIAKMMERYNSVPMSLADACIVRLSETSNRTRVLTTDSDFQIYRKSGRKVIPLLAPWL
jgi:predicted nucleic acid-binding protein